jgi:hypothetical protein
LKKYILCVVALTSILVEWPPAYAVSKNNAELHSVNLGEEFFFSLNTDCCQKFEYKSSFAAECIEENEQAKELKLCSLTSPLFKQNKDVKNNLKFKIDLRSLDSESFFSKKDWWLWNQKNVSWKIKIFNVPVTFVPVWRFRANKSEVFFVEPQKQILPSLIDSFWQKPCSQEKESLFSFLKLEEFYSSEQKVSCVLVYVNGPMIFSSKYLFGNLVKRESILGGGVIRPEQFLEMDVYGNERISSFFDSKCIIKIIGYLPTFCENVIQYQELQNAVYSFGALLQQEKNYWFVSPGEVKPYEEINQKINLVSYSKSFQNKNILKNKAPKIIITQKFKCEFEISDNDSLLIVIEVTPVLKNSRKKTPLFLRVQKNTFHEKIFQRPLSDAQVVSCQVTAYDGQNFSSTEGVLSKKISRYPQLNSKAKNFFFTQDKLANEKNVFLKESQNQNDIFLQTDWKNTQLKGELLQTQYKNSNLALVNAEACFVLNWFIGALQIPCKTEFFESWVGVAKIVKINSYRTLLGVNSYEFKKSYSLLGNLERLHPFLRKNEIGSKEYDFASIIP